MWRGVRKPSVTPIFALQESISPCDIEGAGENASAEYKEILELIKEYASVVSTAQYERRDLQLRRQNKAEGESLIQEIARASKPERTIKERTLLRDARKKIEARLRLIEKAEEKKDASLAEERNTLLYYKNEFDRMCNGNLKVTGKAGEDYQEIAEEPGMLVHDIELEKEDTGFVIGKYYKGSELMDPANMTPVITFEDAKLRKGFKKKELNFRDESETPLFAHEPCVEDVCQGQIGDCYMMACLAGLAEYSPELIKGMMRDNGDTVTVRLYDIAENPPKPVYVTVKKEVPENAVLGEGLDYFAQNCLWVQMIEKAYTVSGLVENQKTGWKKDKTGGDMSDGQYVFGKLKSEGQRAYMSINGGHVEEFIRALLGDAVEGTSFTKTVTSEKLQELRSIRDEKSGRLDKKALDEEKKKLMDGLREAVQNKDTIVFASGRNDLMAVDGLGQSAGEKLMRGFAGKHAFTVMDIVNIGDEEYIALRNPWGWTTATHEVNELTGGTSVNMNRFEATSFLVTPEEYLTYFKGYRSVILNAEKTGKK